MRAIVVMCLLLSVGSVISAPPSDSDANAGTSQLRAASPPPPASNDAAALPKKDVEPKESSEEVKETAWEKIVTKFKIYMRTELPKWVQKPFGLDKPKVAKKTDFKDAAGHKKRARYYRKIAEIMKDKEQKLKNKEKSAGSAIGRFFARIKNFLRNHLPAGLRKLFKMDDPKEKTDDKTTEKNGGAGTGDKQPSEASESQNKTEDQKSPDTAAAGR